MDRRNALVVAFSVLTGLTVVPLANAASTMYDRVCPRVVSRFSDDQKMWERVNARINDRFGFVCERVTTVALNEGESTMNGKHYGLNHATPGNPSLRTRIAKAEK